MARKRTMNYRELRADADEEEDRKDDDEEGDDDDDDDDDDGEEEEEAPVEGAEPSDDGEEGDDEEAPVKKKKVKAKPKPKRTRAAKVVRMRVIWGVFSNSHQMVASYDYPKKGEAEAHAKRFNDDKKQGQPFFIQPVKEPIEEKKEEEEVKKEKKKSK